jgi:hypothetical protein
VRGLVLPAALAALAAPVAAQDRPAAPEWFVGRLVDASMAQAIAGACPTLSVDPLGASTWSQLTLGRLEREGFDPTSPLEGMADPTAALGARQGEVAARLGLADGASPREACAAGRAEIAAGSELGGLLTEVEG